jgi:hypothetical protein
MSKSATPRVRSRMRGRLAVLLAAAAGGAAATTVVAASAGATNRVTPPTGSKRTAGGLVYGGFTSQHWPSFFQLSKDGKTVTSAGLGIELKCGSGATIPVPDTIFSEPIGPGGHLHATYAVPLTSNPDGTSFSGYGEIRATFDNHGNRMTGSWHTHATFISPTGARDECDSGSVAFTGRQ